MLTVDVDLTRLVELRSGWATAGGPLAGIGWTEVLVAAVARTLAEHPHLDVAFDEDRLVVFDTVDVGVVRAVDGVAGGEVGAAAVVVEADRRSLPEITAALEAAGPAGEAGTITVWDAGALGVRTVTPVLEASETLRVVLGVVEPRAVARGGEVVVATVGTVSTAFDHRLVGSGAAAGFLTDLRRRLESPDRHL